MSHQGGDEILFWAEFFNGIELFENWNRQYDSGLAAIQCRRGGKICPNLPI